MLLQASSLVKKYGNLCVLDNVSVDIAEHEVVAIAGPSGAGKTTLLQVLGTLDRPDAGEVRFDDVNILTLKEKPLARFRNRNIGFVFQFHQLLPEFSLLENVEMPMLIAGGGQRQARERAMRLIEYLGLADRIHHRPAQLSGGECQRAAVARALVNSPRVVLADEPTGSLDSQNRRELQRLFFDLRRDFGQTFVIVTHDEALANEADRVIHMRDGKIVN